MRQLERDHLADPSVRGAQPWLQAGPARSRRLHGPDRSLDPTEPTPLPLGGVWDEDRARVLLAQVNRYESRRHRSPAGQFAEGLPKCGPPGLLPNGPRDLPAATATACLHRAEAEAEPDPRLRAGVSGGR